MTGSNHEIIALGDLLDDLEKARIACSNRLEAEPEFEHPALRVALSEAVRVEWIVRKSIEKAWKRHPLAPWASTVPGAGAILMARLIAVIGDPAERENPAKLWAYCGHGEPTRQRACGMSQADLFACGNPRAKKRVYLLASQFKRTTNTKVRCPYRDAYEHYRDLYADRTHESSCKRCGPSGKPALPGSPWSLAHQDAAAVRRVGKDFLKDLWVAARVLHSDHEAPGRPEGAGRELIA